MFLYELRLCQKRHRLRVINLIDLLADQDDLLGVNRLLKIHVRGFESFDAADLSRDGRRFLGAGLPCGRAVHFITVVLGRVVARGNHDACRKAELPYGEAELRNRAQ